MHLLSCWFTLLVVREVLGAANPVKHLIEAGKDSVQTLATAKTCGLRCLFRVGFACFWFITPAISSHRANALREGEGNTKKGKDHMKTYKTVDWSYPTSTNAKRFGFPDGCWTVNLLIPKLDYLGRDCFVTRSQKAFEDRAEAEAFAHTLLAPWLYVPKQYAEPVLATPAIS